MASSTGGRGLEVLPGVRLIEGLPALCLEHLGAVVIADLHLGYEEAMARQGVYLPRLQYRKAVRIIGRAREACEANRLIIDGDIKHEFSRLLRSEKLEVAKLIRAAFEAGYREVIVVRGNHDNYVGPLIESLGGEFVEEVREGEILLTHGHKRLEGDLPGVVIIGHEHPSLSVSIGGMKAKFPVFLITPRKDGGIIIVLPAAGAYQTGNTIGLDRSAYLSPLMRDEAVIEEITPVIVDEKEGLLPLPKLSLLTSIV